MQRKPFLVTLALLVVFAIVSAGSSGGQRAQASAALSTISATKSTSPNADLGEAFTYQGKLNVAGLPANGQYDFEFKLYDALVGGTQSGDTLNIGNVTVTDGLFTVAPDFGNSNVFNGSDCFLQIAVRPAGGGTYTTLTPRQAITAAPFASSLVPGAYVEGSDVSDTLFLRNSALGGTGLNAYSESGYAVTATSGAGTAINALAQNATTIKAQNNSEANSTISANNFDSGYAVQGISTGGTGVSGIGNNNGTGVRGEGGGTEGIGVYGTGYYGVEGYSTAASNGRGVSGESTTPNGIGVYGKSSANGGVAIKGVGTGNADAGNFEGTVDVEGELDVSNSNNGSAIYATTTSNSLLPVIFAHNFGTGDGVLAFSDGGTGAAISGAGFDGALAGRFQGNVDITGNLSKGGGSFKIDSPLDPANKYLYHSFVESPDMMNIYNGNVTTDASGNATVTLPNYFNALNRDYRYQLTVMGQQFAQAIVSSKVAGNKFSIKTDKPNIEVSWQVTGIRQDPYANTNRIPVEVDKAADDKGKYLYPEVYGKSDDLKIGPKLPVEQPQSPKTTVAPGK